MLSILRKIYYFIFPKSGLIELNKELIIMNEYYESKKVIKIIRKDSFDSSHSHLVESGFLSPLEYYRLKESLSKLDLLQQ